MYEEIFRKEREFRILVSSLEEKNKILFELYQFGFELRSKRQLFYFLFEETGDYLFKEWIIVSLDGIYFIPYDMLRAEEKKLTVAEIPFFMYLFQEKKLELIKKFQLNDNFLVDEILLDEIMKVPFKHVKDKS